MILIKSLQSQPVQDLITAIPWVQHYGGVAIPVRKSFGSATVGGQDRPIYKTFPVSCTLTDAECWQDGKYKNLVPATRYRSLLYWEVRSDARFEVNNRTPPKGLTMTGTVRLVYWLNLAKNGIDKDSSKGAYFGAHLANSLDCKYFQVDNGINLYLSSPTMVQKNARTIFPYDYDHGFEAMTVYPYDFGAIDLKAEVHISPHCLDDIVTATPIECITNW